VSQEAAGFMATTFGPPMVWDSLAATAWPALRRQMERRLPGFDQ